MDLPRHCVLTGLMFPCISECANLTHMAQRPEDQSPSKKANVVHFGAKFSGIEHASCTHAGAMDENQ